MIHGHGVGVGGRLEREEVSHTPSHASPNQQPPALGPDQLWWPLARSCTGQDGVDGEASVSQHGSHA